MGNISNLITSITSFSSSLAFNNNNNEILNKLKYKAHINTNILKPSKTIIKPNIEQLDLIYDITDDMLIKLIGKLYIFL